MRAVMIMFTLSLLISSSIISFIHEPAQSLSNGGQGTENIVRRTVGTEIDSFSADGTNIQGSSDPFADIAGNGVFFNETCEWQILDMDHSPNMRNSIEMTPIDSTGEVILFGGDHNGDANNEKDTWIYDHGDGEWRLHDMGQRPPGTESYGLATIFGTWEVLHFGGYTSPTYIDPARWSDETWTFNSNIMRWEQIDTSFTPEGRINMNIAGIYGTEKVVMFGGYNMDDDRTYVYDHGKKDWEIALSSGGPRFRTKGVFCPIYGTDKVFYYNHGYDEVQGTVKENWIYDLSENIWIEKSPPKIPNTDSKMSNGAYLKGDDKVLFSTGELTFCYDHSKDEWMTINTTNDPGIRDRHSFSNIPGTGCFILFGGTDYRGDIGNSTSILDIEKHYPEGTISSGIITIPESGELCDIGIKGYLPQGTAFRSQIRSGNSPDLSYSGFIGPSGDDSTYYYGKYIDEIWPGHMEHRYIQVKVKLQTGSQLFSPTVGGMVAGYMIEIPNDPPYIMMFDDPYVDKDELYIELRCVDNDTEWADLYFDYSVDGGEFFECDLNYMDNPVLHIETTFNEPLSILSFRWDMEYDLEGIQSNNIMLRITPSNDLIGSSYLAGPFSFDDRPPEPVLEDDLGAFLPGGSIVVEFDERIYDDHYYRSSTRISHGLGSITHEMDIEDRNLTLTPLQYLDPGLEYTLTIIRFPEDAHGNRLDYDMTFTFRTVVNIPFHVIDIDFNTSEEGTVVEDAEFMISFSTEIDWRWDNPDHIDFYSIGKQEHYSEDFERGVLANKVRIKPYRDLVYGSEYIIDISPELRSMDGFMIGERTKFVITVEDPPEYPDDDDSERRGNGFFIGALITGSIMIISSISVSIFIYVKDRGRKGLGSKT